MRLLQRPAELCVDFGFDSAFAIEIEHGSIVRWTTWALPSGSFRQGEAVDTNRLGDQMCAALDEAGFRARRARMTIADEAVVTRIVEVPRMRNREMARAAAFMAEKELPIPFDRAAWSWDLIETPGRISALCLVAAWRDLVERLEAMVFRANILLEVVEPRALALARALDLESGILLEAIGDTARVTAVAPGVAPYVEQLALPRDPVSREKFLTTLIGRLTARYASGPGAAQPLIVLAGELEYLRLAGVESIPASERMNGHTPLRPADLPVAFFLPTIGLGMRRR
jgi:hypothetical protein